MQTKRLLCAALSFLVLVCGNALAQEKITLKLDGVTLREAFTAVEKASNYSFFYDAQTIDTGTKVSVNVKNSDIESTMKAVLQGTGISFTIKGKQIALIPPPTGESRPARKYTVNGTVVDGTGVGIVGVAVMSGRQGQGCLTDIDGHFSLDIDSDVKTLTFSCLGYADKSITAPKDSNPMRVVLDDDTLAIEETVVVGYGSQSKRLVSSSITSVKMDQIDRGAEIDPIKALQGRAPGVNINNSSGIPGSSPNVIIRGVNSISGSSSPLYVVDGIPAESYPNINSSDIESIEVLKDASATAIYGSRANSGVIVITTKSGKSGKPIISVNGTYGLSTIAKDIKMANTAEYIRTMQDAFDNYNLQMTQLKTFEIPENLEDFDWIGSVSRNIAQRYTASASVQAGNEWTQAFLSFGAEDQQGYLNKTNFAKYTLRSKVNQKLTDWLKVNLNLSGAFARYDMVEEQDGSLKVLRAAREEQPWYTPYCVRSMDSKGRETRANAYGGDYRTMSSDGLVRHNPVMAINEEDYWTNKFQLQGSLSMDFTPFKGFKFTPSLSAYTIYDHVSKKLTELNTERGYKDGWSALAEQKNVSLRYVFDAVASYDNKWKDLTYNVMAGFSYENYAYSVFGVRSDNYANSAFPSSSFNLVTSGSNIYANGFSYNAYALESWFARTALNWKDRYVLNASFRTDGSSRFPKSSRFGFFPAASLAWIVSNEEFFPKTDVLDELKFRVSAGQTGSMAGIGNWAAMDLVGAGSSYNGESGLSFSTPAQNLKWEVATKYNAGLNAEFFKGRMSIDFDYFHSTTDDLLYQKPVIVTSGYKTLTANIGSITNDGVELSIGGTPLKTGDFQLYLGANISYNRNRLTRLLDDKDIIPLSQANLYGGTKHALVTGQPVSTWYMLNFEGIYQSDDEVPEKLYAKGVRAGDCIYTDVNGDGDIDYNDDRMIVGKATPDFFGGVDLNFSWKGLELSMFCQYSIGGKVFAAWKGCGQEGTEHLGLSSGTVTDDSGKSVTNYFNISKHAANNYWREGSGINDIPRPVLAGVHTGWDVDYNILTSTRYLEDASYFKFKTITLSYRLPDKALRAIKSTAAKLFFTIDNAFTITRYDGYDPEVSMASGPAAAGYAVDFGYQPSLRSYLFGIQLQF